MKKLIKSLNTVRKWEKKSLENVAYEYSVYSRQIIPQSVVDEFRFTGLSNTDFIQSDFLNNYGIKNIFQLK